MKGWAKQGRKLFTLRKDWLTDVGWYLIQNMYCLHLTVTIITITITTILLLVIIMLQKPRIRVNIYGAHILDQWMTNLPFPFYSPFMSEVNEKFTYIGYNSSIQNPLTLSFFSQVHKSALDMWLFKTGFIYYELFIFIITGKWLCGNCP